MLFLQHALTIKTYLVYSVNSVCRIGSRKDIVGGFCVAHQSPAKNCCSFNSLRMIGIVNDLHVYHNATMFCECKMS